VKRLLAALVLASAGAATAEPLAAVALAPDPLASTLVGPSGQVWQPDGHGAWTRDAGGGGADAGGGGRAQLVVVGKATPAYRLDPDGWQALRLGERGKTVMGGGPHPAFAIGRNVFVWKAKAWVRVGAAPAGIVALWAGSDSKVYVAGADRLWRLAGKRLVDHATASVTRFASGAAPLAIAADGALFDVAAKAAAPVVLGGERLTPLAATARRRRVGGAPPRPILARRVRGQEVAAPASPTTIARAGRPADGTCSCRWPAARCGCSAAAPEPGHADAPAFPPGPGPARMP
jgi:hypothetical protein